MYCFLPFLVPTTILLVLYTYFITLIYLIWKKVWAFVKRSIPIWLAQSPASSTFGCSRTYSIESDIRVLPITTTRNTGKTRVCHTVALPFTLKSILRRKKNYENSNISPLKNIIFKKSSKRNQNPARYYNSITSLKFQHKPKYHLSKILTQAKIP